jgi:hypothetical protein
MRIRALSVFEGVVYHCTCVDARMPCTPTLEVDALLRPGDADVGPLLITVADYLTLSGDPEATRRCLDEFDARGRIVDHLGVPHLAFPTWTPVSG